ncbi:MAG: S-adenosylmethionine:tRNA ribosyltransferase-isomerase [Muribaculum sp.]|nr:S-adenosylmethionine:tRNA ribosyltransferase-isomerase [Muribaculum sp.]
MESQDVFNIKIEDFNYNLPDERIAKHPLAIRDSCKLLLRESGGEISEHVFRDVVALLPHDSMLVYNDTRVINARLRFQKAGGGAVIEIFCLEPTSPSDYALNLSASGTCEWLCFVGNSKRWKDGLLTHKVTVYGNEMTVKAERLRREGNASVVRFSWDSDDSVTFSDILLAMGEIPIPPYLNRDTEKSDTTDYQTVYSIHDGSVAAPTAGLHFTESLLAEISGRGIPSRQVTLHVGAGTFQPVKSEHIGQHDMHSEFIAVSRDFIEELATTDRKVIAVGTTSVRTLESLYHIGCLMSQDVWDGQVPQWYPYSDKHPHLNTAESLKIVLDYLDQHSSDTLIASTRIIIAPGYTFKVVKGMITNFHQPQSTLLLLVSAFVGGDWKAMYDFALANEFRFLSYGDASLIFPDKSDDTCQSIGNNLDIEATLPMKS